MLNDIMKTNKMIRNINILFKIKSGLSRESDFTMGFRQWILHIWPRLIIQTRHCSLMRCNETQEYRNVEKSVFLPTSVLILFVKKNWDKKGQKLEGGGARNRAFIFPSILNKQWNKKRSSNNKTITIYSSWRNNSSQLFSLKIQALIKGLTTDVPKKMIIKNLYYN